MKGHKPILLFLLILLLSSCDSSSKVQAENKYKVSIKKLDGQIITGYVTYDNIDLPFRNNTIKVEIENVRYITGMDNVVIEKEVE